MKEFFKKNAVPVLLFTFLYSSVVYIYARSDLTAVTLLTLLGFVFALLLFAVYEKLLKLGKQLVTTLATGVLVLLSSFIGASLIETDMDTFAQWLLEPSRFNSTFTGNIAALLFCFGIILGDALFYFTRVRYRAVSVFLICMCPFSLYAKTFTDIPVIYIILSVTLFLVLMIIKTGGESVFYGRAAYIAFGLFVGAVACSAAFLPKLDAAPFREEFDELITGIQIGARGRADFNGFSDASSNTTPDDDETVVFTIYGDNPGLIKRQCFNQYHPETEQWGYSVPSDTGYNNWGEYVNWENPQVLSNGYDGEIRQTAKSAWIRSEQGKLRALYTPENMTGIEVYDAPVRNIYRTPMDEYFVSSGSTDPRSFKIEWSEFSIDTAFSEAYGKETEQSGGGYWRTYAEMREIYDVLFDEKERRKSFNSDDGFRRIGELAASLTEGAETDLEKAAAIESFFLSEDFVYDDAFAPADSSVENFVFSTHRGVCSDYATAMALLCREAGLYSRYVEGFNIHRQNDLGQYYVTAADSHAYVQVWIDGYGWTDFDPTSGNTDDGYFDRTFLVFGGILLLAGGVTAGVLLLIPVAKRRRFMRRASKLKGREQLLLLYPELNRFLHEKLGKKQPVFTVSELKERTAKTFGTDISLIADSYERAAYGGIETGGDYLAAYREIVKAVGTAEKERRKAAKKGSDANEKKRKALA